METSLEYNKLKASYEALQRDYTKKCQILKTLKNGGNASDNATAPVAAADFIDNLSEAQIEQILQDERIIKRAAAIYIEKIRKGDSPILITAHGEIKAMKSLQPTTLREAGEIAKKVLKTI